MSSIQKLLQEIVVFDGAMGTMLQQAGLKGGECPESWNLEAPHVLQEIHQAYLQAGAKVITTNTFGASPIKLQEYGLRDLTAQINQQGAKLAKAVAGAKALVAGSVGPTGLLMEPFGTATFDDFYQAFEEQVLALAAGGADLIIFETMSDLSEIRAGLLAAKAVTRLPIFCSMTFDKNGRTIMGIAPETAAYVLEALGADAIGANCSTGPKELLTVVEKMAAVTNLPLIVQPNAGLPVLKNGKIVYDETPDTFADFAHHFVQKGVGILGGCCGTTPEHIRQLRHAVEGLTATPRRQCSQTVVASRRKLYVVEEQRAPLTIGSGIDLKSRHDLQADLEAEQVDSFFNAAMSQIEHGAAIIQFNVGSLAVKPRNLQQAIMHVQSSLDVPIAINAQDEHILTEGLKVVQGKGLIVSSSATADKHLSNLKLAQKYGVALVVTLQGSDVSKEDIVASLALEARALGVKMGELIIACQVSEIKDYQGAIQLLRKLQQEYKLKTGLMLIANNGEHLDTIIAKAAKDGLSFLCYNPEKG